MFEIFDDLFLILLPSLTLLQITSLGAEAVICAERIAKQADIVAAITLEVLKGTTRAFDQNIHDLRPHKGQSLVAETLRSLLHSEIYKSEIAESHRFCQRVQDAYTIRCCPQVHGIGRFFFLR